jgi:hypothetical protein
MEIDMNKNDVVAIRITMKQLVSGYTASDEVVDWISLEKTAS